MGSPRGLDRFLVGIDLSDTYQPLGIYFLRRFGWCPWSDVFPKKRFVVRLKDGQHEDEEDCTQSRQLGELWPLRSIITLHDFWISEDEDDKQKLFRIGTARLKMIDVVDH